MDRALEIDLSQGVLMEHLTDGVQLCRDDGIIFYTNVHFDRLFGYETGELIGRHASELNAPGERLPDEIAAEILRHLRDHGVWQGDIHNRRKDGTTFWSSARVSSVKHPSLGPILISIHTDVTARKRIEEADHSAPLAETEFLARVSHEIRTPINGILGMARKILRERLPPRVRGDLEILSASAETLHRLLDDLLDFSRIASGTLSIECADFSLRGVARSVTDLLRPGAEQKALKLHLEIGDLPPDDRVRGDADRLRQVLINLVSNAIKFTHTGHITLRVSAAAEGTLRRVRFLVEDTGVGVPDNYISQLFEAFTQADGSTTRHFGGVGLGLAISHKLITAMGGEIELLSTSPEGSIFAATIPLARPDPAKPAPVAAPEEARLARREERRILLAEDDEVSHLIALSTLGALGYRVDGVRDGVQALEALGRTRYDLVLLDCRMPRMDGYEVARRVRRGEVGDPDVPLLALTAGAREEDRKRSLAAGMNEHLAKPFSEARLAEELDRWLGISAPPPASPRRHATPTARRQTAARALMPGASRAQPADTSPAGDRSSTPTDAVNRTR